MTFHFIKVPVVHKADMTSLRHFLWISYFLNDFALKISIWFSLDYVQDVTDYGVILLLLIIVIIIDDWYLLKLSSHNRVVFSISLFFMYSFFCLLVYSIIYFTCKLVASSKRIQLFSWSTTISLPARNLGRFPVSLNFVILWWYSALKMMSLCHIKVIVKP
jgi:hypothetical protein